ncbi:hypothetical protein BV20DRAFT_1058420 [Pilatotrama ljubarskyi]|nr:hypothetical protein BV20DRAFT_1058420 [Pilatotrama ljubarskyi]
MSTISATQPVVRLSIGGAAVQFTADASESILWTPGIALQQVAGDTSEALPIVKHVWKSGVNCFSKEKIRRLLEQGLDELHAANEILNQPEAMAALKRVLSDLGIRFNQDVESLRFYQLGKKYNVRLLLLEWKKRSSRHKYSVISKSDRARLGLHPTLSSASLPVNAIHRDQISTLPAGSATSSERTQGVVQGHANPGESLVAETDSIFGNPWLGHRGAAEHFDELPPSYADAPVSSIQVTTSTR